MYTNCSPIIVYKLFCKPYTILKKKFLSSSNEYSLIIKNPYLAPMI